MNDPTIISSEELQNHDYRFVVRRNSPEPTGWCGTFYGEDLIAGDGFIEAAVRNFFGGGRYSVKLYKDSIPQPGVIRVHIAGTPKKQRSRKERKESETENEVEKLEKRVEKLKEEIKKESEQKVDELKDEPGESALEKMIFAFSETFTEEDKTGDFMEELFSKLESLAVDIIKEVKTEKESESETVAEIKDATAENQNQIENINLHLKRQDSELNQVNKSINSVIKNMKIKEFEQRRKEAEQEKNTSGWKDLTVIGAVAGIGLYLSSPRVKQFIDQNLLETFSLSKKVDTSGLAGMRTRNQSNSSETFQGRVFPQLKDTILGDFPKSII